MMPTSGTSNYGKDWFKQTLIIGFEDGNYFKQLQLDSMKAGALNGLAIGDNVEVKFNIESKEYNGKYYTNCNVWSIKKI